MTPMSDATDIGIDALLSSPDEEARYRAAMSAIGLDDSSKALRVLARCLGDESWRVRKAAVEGLLSCPEREKVVELSLEALADEENAGSRNAAAETLVGMGAEATERLVHRLDDPREDVRKMLVDTLGEIGRPAATRALAGRLGDQDENVRSAAAEALGKIGGEEAQAILMDMLDRGDLLLTISTLEALGRSGAVVPFSKLEHLIEKRLVRRPLLVLLARLEGDEVLEAILSCLKDPSRGTRESALAALAQWCDAHDSERSRLASFVSRARFSVSLGREGLGSESFEARAAAMDLLAIAGDPRVAPGIIRAADDERLQERALSAIERLGAEAARELVREFQTLTVTGQTTALESLKGFPDELCTKHMISCLEHNDTRVRLAAVDALAGAAKSRAIEPMAAMLGCSDRLLAGAVVSAMSRLGQSDMKSVLAACERCLASEDALKVADACRVISEMGQPVEMSLLLQVLRHQDPIAREAAASALAGVDRREVVEQLRHALADESTSVREAVARSLGTHGGEEAVKALLVALKDEEPTVSGAAAEALGSRNDPSLGKNLLCVLGSPERPGPAPAAFEALRAICRIRAPETAEALRQAAAHPEGEVAKEAVCIAEELAGEEGVRVLLVCARHPAWDVRRAAAAALGRLGNSLVLPEMELLARDEEDEMVAEAMAEAIRVLRGFVR